MLMSYAANRLSAAVPGRLDDEKEIRAIWAAAASLRRLETAPSFPLRANERTRRMRKTGKPVCRRRAEFVSALCTLFLFAAMAAGQAPASGPRPGEDIAIHLTADATGPGRPLVHFWSKVVGAGRANEGLRSTWQEELAIAAKYDGFQYVRFHGIFQDDMFVYREDALGNPVYNFQYVDDLYDRMLAQGVRPFVELSFSPGLLAPVHNTTFWWRADGSPPSDYNKWADLVHAFVQHCIDRYGIDEVRRWYFEVWNEPNLYESFFRGGSQEKYFDLYRVTVQTIKAIDPELRVGGPATSNFNMDSDALEKAEASGKPFDPFSIPWRPVWITDFLNYCQQNHLTVDFVSTHPYPQDFAIDQPGVPERQHYRRSIDATRDDLRTIQEIVSHSDYPKAEIHLTEWNSSPSPVDHAHDSLAAAAFVAKTNLESIGLVDSLSYWVFTDVFEENRNIDSIFHGGFGLINYQEIVKPAFHAYRMMNELGDQILAQVPGGIVTRFSKSGLISAVAYNYPSEMKASLPVSTTLQAADAIDGSGSARPFTLDLTHLPPGASFLIETLDQQHGDAVAAWEAMGKPEPPNRKQTELLREEAWNTRKDIMRADAQGRLHIQISLPPWALMSVRQM
jgi:xylan 1,4-beta-xylosidase